MTRRDALATCAIALPAEPPEWVQLVPLGTIQGRDGRAWHLADRAAAEQVVRNTQAFAGAMRLVVDYDHQSDFAAVPKVGGTAPAAGWIEELQVRDDGIYGRVEWTAPAAQRLQAREYRYLSPVFSHLADGQVTKLLRAGLTNKPNVDLVALNSQEATPVIPAAILAALALAATADEAAVLVAINALRDTARAAGEGLALCAQAAGVQATATAAEVEAAIKAKSAADPAKFVPIEQVSQLQQQVATLQGDLNKGKVTAAVDEAVRAGKVAPALRDWAMDYATKDLVAFNAYVAKQPALVTATAQLPGGRPLDATSDLTQEEQAVCAQLGLTPEKFKAAKAA